LIPETLVMRPGQILPPAANCEPLRDAFRVTEMIDR
jgi:hypothetical protein